MTPSDPFSDINDSDKTVVRPNPGGRRQSVPALQVFRADSAGAVENANLHDLVLEEDNPLIGGASSLLALVPKLRNTPFCDSVDVLRERLVAEIKAFEHHAIKRGVPQNQVEVSKYFLCLLLDETVLNTPWGSQSGWGHNSLSSLFYRKLAGGEEFFQIIDRLIKNPENNTNLLELAYYCLSMGFEGKFRYINNGLISLERQRQEIYLALQRIKGDPNPALSVQWTGAQKGQNTLIRRVPLWVLGGICGVILMLVYMIMMVSMSGRSDPIYDNLVEAEQNVKNTLPPELVLPVQTQRPAAPFKELLKQVLAEEISRHQVDVVDGPILRLFDMFPSGGAEISIAYRDVLSKIAHALKEKKAHLTIVGHTDNQRLRFSSRFNSNWRLSQARAESTADALRQYGIAEDLIDSKAMADKEPIAPNDTPANQALNRRIDIHIR